jgi:hypothetical protein
LELTNIVQRLRESGKKIVSISWIFDSIGLRKQQDERQYAIGVPLSTLDLLPARNARARFDPHAKQEPNAQSIPNVPLQKKRKGFEDYSVSSERQHSPKRRSIEERYDSAKREMRQSVVNSSNTQDFNVTRKLTDDPILVKAVTKESWSERSKFGKDVHLLVRHILNKGQIKDALMTLGATFENQEPYVLTKFEHWKATTLLANIIRQNRHDEGRRTRTRQYRKDTTGASESWNLNSSNLRDYSKLEEKYGDIIKRLPPNNQNRVQIDHDRILSEKTYLREQYHLRIAHQFSEFATSVTWEPPFDYLMRLIGVDILDEGKLYMVDIFLVVNLANIRSQQRFVRAHVIEGLF